MKSRKHATPPGVTRGSGTARKARLSYPITVRGGKAVRCSMGPRLPGGADTRRPYPAPDGGVVAGEPGGISVPLLTGNLARSDEPAGRGGAARRTAVAFRTSSVVGAPSSPERRRLVGVLGANVPDLDQLPFDNGSV